MLSLCQSDSPTKYKACNISFTPHLGQPRHLTWEIKIFMFDNTNQMWKQMQGKTTKCKLQKYKQKKIRSKQKLQMFA